MDLRGSWTWKGGGYLRLSSGHGVAELDTLLTHKHSFCAHLDNRLLQDNTTPTYRWFLQFLHACKTILSYTTWKNVLQCMCRLPVECKYNKLIILFVIKTGHRFKGLLSEQQKTTQEKAEVFVCTHEGQWERDRLWEEDRDGGGLSNTLLIKVKEMFYSWSRRRQRQQRQQGQGWNELASTFPRARAAHSLTPGQRTLPLTVINNVKTQATHAPTSLTYQ